MRKKILFVIPEYSHGGTNKSLENLLQFLDKEKYEIGIYCIYEDGGKLYKNIFKPYILRKSIFYKIIHDNYITRKIANIIRKLIGWKSWERLYRWEIKRIQKEYSFETIIAYQEGAASYFVSYFENVKRIAWVHCDYGVSYWENNREDESELYNVFDKIVCVSNCAANSFVNVYPHLKEKVIDLYNTIDTGKIVSASMHPTEDFKFENKVFTLISIGRFVKLKQFHLIPDICKRIKDMLPKCKFRWYLIAPHGINEDETKRKIIEYELEDILVLLGAKNNPYPYIAQSNLLVCTSATESFSYVIAEAKILHTPILSNNFPVAYEVLSKECGWVCSIDEMDKLLYDIINDKDGVYSDMKEKISSYEYNNLEIIDKINSFL